MLTILTELASLFTILIGFELLPLLTGTGGGFLPSISSLRPCPREPKTFLSSHMSTYQKGKRCFLQLRNVDSVYNGSNNSS